VPIIKSAGVLHFGSELRLQLGRKKEYRIEDPVQEAAMKFGKTKCKRSLEV